VLSAPRRRLCFGRRRLVRWRSCRRNHVRVGRFFNWDGGGTRPSACHGYSLQSLATASATTWAEHAPGVTREAGLGPVQALAGALRRGRQGLGHARAWSASTPALGAVGPRPTSAPARAARPRPRTGVVGINAGTRRGRTPAGLGSGEGAGAQRGRADRAPPSVGAACPGPWRRARPATTARA
jgi:hypothetical protein